jgi:hypothetical protein
MLAPSRSSSRHRIKTFETLEVPGRPDPDARAYGMTLSVPTSILRSEMLLWPGRLLPTDTPHRGFAGDALGDQRLFSAWPLSVLSVCPNWAEVHLAALI